MDAELCRCPAELRVPQDLALAQHGRAGDSRELFLLSDAGQAHMHTVIGLENIRSVARNVRFLRHDEAVPAGGEMYCKFVQHATDYKYTDLLPPQARTWPLLTSDFPSACSGLAAHT